MMIRSGVVLTMVLIGDQTGMMSGVDGRVVGCGRIDKPNN